MLVKTLEQSAAEAAGAWGPCGWCGQKHSLLRHGVFCSERCSAAYGEYSHYLAELSPYCEDIVLTREEFEMWEPETRDN